MSIDLTQVEVSEPTFKQRLYDQICDALSTETPWNPEWFKGGRFRDIIDSIQSVHDTASFGTFSVDDLVDLATPNFSYLRRQQLRYAAERAIFRDDMPNLWGWVAVGLFHVNEGFSFPDDAMTGDIRNLRLVVGHLAEGRSSTTFSLRVYRIEGDPAGESPRIRIGGESRCCCEKNWLLVPGVKYPRGVQEDFPVANGQRIDVGYDDLWSAGFHLGRALRAAVESQRYTGAFQSQAGLTRVEYLKQYFRHVGQLELPSFGVLHRSGEAAGEAGPTINGLEFDPIEQAAAGYQYDLRNWIDTFGSAPQVFRLPFVGRNRSNWGALCWSTPHLDIDLLSAPVWEREWTN